MLLFSVFRRVRALGMGAVGLAVFLLLPDVARAQAPGTAVQVPDTADAIVQVRGMACSNCAQRMKNALEAVEGVERATVRLEKQNVVLTLNDAKIPTEKTLRETVMSAGYEFRTAAFAETRGSDGSGR